MKATVSKKHIECARVYVDRNNRTIFRLKCFYCCSVFLHWTRFTQHIEMRHSDLERAYVRAKPLWAEGNTTEEQENRRKRRFDACRRNGGTLKHIAVNAELEETEIVLISEEVLDLVPEATESGKAECVGLKAELLPDVANEVIEGSKQQQELVPSNAAMNSRNDNNDSDSYTIYEAAGPSTKRKRRQRSSVPKVSKRKIVNECRQNKRNPAINTKLLKEHAHKSVVHKIVKDPDNREIVSVDKESLQSANGVEQMPRRTRSTWTGRIFYNIRDTNPEIILNFIDMIRHQPCQWNPQDSDYRVKDKRDESSEQMCMTLQERWNISTTPQVVRNSVLSLFRWFETEYMRAKQEGSQFKCTHPDYYAKLYAFLPHQDIKYFPCEQCTRKFKSEALLRSHKYVAHNGEIPYKCCYCSRSFLHLSSFRHHENRHTKEHVWPCELCDYRSPTKTDYTLHKITHTDIRAYVCDLCGAAYKSSTSLNVHKRSHGPPQLKCDECGRQFHENYRLKRHMRIKHGDETVALQQHKYQCKICEATFARNGNLRNHLAKHREKGELTATPKIIVDTDEEDDMMDLVEQLNMPAAAAECNEQHEEKQEEVVNSEEEEELEDNDVASLQSDEEDVAITLLGANVEQSSSSNSGDDQRCQLEVFSCVACHTQFMTLQALRAHSLNSHNRAV